MIITMIFNMSISYFHKISFCYFEDYLMTELTLGKGIGCKHDKVQVVQDSCQFSTR
jgi:hypothetical protein